jgi:hypothetical protein
MKNTDERDNHAEALSRRHKGIGRKAREATATAERTDGLGDPLIADALYYLQDSRVFVGNCGSWWAPNGAGYCCSIDEAGKYTGKEAAALRGTDVPWPVEYVLQHIVRHVRVDGKAFSRENYKPGSR